MDINLEFNLKIIQRHDPTAKNIIYNVNHIVLYQFIDGKWVCNLHHSNNS